MEKERAHLSLEAKTNDNSFLCQLEFIVVSNIHIQDLNYFPPNHHIKKWRKKDIMNDNNIDRN